MATRSLTIISDDKEICVMYRQFDGYIDGHGYELAAFLSGMTIVNGLGGEKTKVANGATCLAAQVIAHFKAEPGGIYLYPSGTRSCGEEFTYFVTAKEGEPITVKVVAYEEEIFSGVPEELALFKNQKKTSPHQFTPLGAAVRLSGWAFSNNADLFKVGGFMPTQSVAVRDLNKGDLVRIHGQHAIVKRLSAVEGGWEVRLLIGEGEMVHKMSHEEANEQIPLLRQVK